MHRDEHDRLSQLNTRLISCLCAWTHEQVKRVMWGDIGISVTRSVSGLSKCVLKNLLFKFKKTLKNLTLKVRIF